MSRILLLALLQNTQVQILSGSSVNISWDSIDNSEITGYLVYYHPTRDPHSEQFVNVSKPDNSVIIRDLESHVTYQFQVVAIDIFSDAITAGELHTLTVAHEGWRNLISLHY